MKKQILQDNLNRCTGEYVPKKPVETSFKEVFEENIRKRIIHKLTYNPSMNDHSWPV